MAKQQEDPKCTDQQRYDSDDTERMSYSGVDNSDDDPLKTPAMIDS